MCTGSSLPRQLLPAPLFLPANLSPEFRCLLLVARPQSAGPPPEGLDWAVLLSLARRHGLWPLLWRWVETLPVEAVPAAIRAELQRAQPQLALRNLRLTGELWTLLRLFAAHGIAAIPVKGPTLAMLAYGDVAGREFGDLDLLVARQDVARASTLLQQQGYELALDWAATHDPRFLDVTYDLEFVQRSKGVMVELHWALLPAYLGFDFDLRHMRQRLVTVRPGGKPMPTFAAADLLVYLSAHAAKHLWHSLKSVADLAWLIHSQAEWDWERILAEARSRRLDRVVLLGLVLVNELLGVSIPHEILTRAWAQPGFRNLIEQTVVNLTAPAGSAGGMWRQFRYFYHLQPGWQARVRYGIQLIASPNVGDWEFWPLSRPWQWLYFLVRPVRLLRDRLP